MFVCVCVCVSVYREKQGRAHTSADSVSEGRVGGRRCLNSLVFTEVAQVCSLFGFFQPAEVMRVNFNTYYPHLSERSLTNKI